MFKRIVAATDFSESSRRGVDLAVDLARLHGAELVLLHVIEPFIPPYPIALAPEPGTLEGAARAALETELSQVREVLPAARGELLRGSPSHELTKFAEEQGADLLVIGTHGRKGPSRWILGSVAERVVRSSRAPVLTVRGEDS